MIFNIKINHTKFMNKYDFKLDMQLKNTMSVIINWIKPGSTVLEFGPATGRLTKFLSQQMACAVTIVEIDEISGKDAKIYAKKSFLGKKKGDIENFYWYKKSKGKFDYIIFADVLEHLRNPQAVINKCSDVLGDDGEILISIPNVTHNSIIIDLMKNKFLYQKLGLLDETHIHFFTYESFCEMIKEVDLVICGVDFIYSRVGNNEIKNTYFDIPTEVSNYLRKREEGSIYQYLFKICKKQERKIDLDRVKKGLEIDYVEGQEGSCYLLIEGEQVYSESNRVSKLFNSDDNQVIFEIPKCKGVTRVRWDPLEYNGLFYLKNYKALDNNGEEVGFHIISHNAELEINNFYIFYTEDPQIEFELDTCCDVKLVLFEFTLIMYRFELNKKIEFIVEKLRGVKSREARFQIDNNDVESEE